MRAGPAASLLLLLAAATACSAPGREPLPKELLDQAQPVGLPGVRYWGDVLTDELVEAALESVERELAHHASQGRGWPARADFLALSGGGSNGAFGAGLLCGWSAAGDRPAFKLVTGISTGALIAPFAYLGTECDATLRELYTTTSTDDLIEMRGKLSILFSESAADSAPLAAQIARVVDEALLARVAEEHGKGRLLFVATTHLDAGRPVIWDMGRIAASGAPGALDLFRAVLLASASIPGAFPPVMIPVEAGGGRYDEMHVDGGTSAQVFLYPEALDVRRRARERGLDRARRVFVVRNSKLAPEWAAVERKVFDIAARSISSLIRTQGIGDLYRIYAETVRAGVEYRLAFIPDEFDHERDELFDPVYMSALFALGEGLGRDGYPWLDGPPGLDEAEPDPRVEE